MGLSRTNFVPVLAIVAGGVIGASLSFGFLALRSEDVPAQDLLFGPSVAVESTPQRIDLSHNLRVVRGFVEKSEPHWVLSGARIEVDGMVLTGNRIHIYADGRGMVLMGDKTQVEIVVTDGSITRDGYPVVTSAGFEIYVIDLAGIKIEADKMVLSGGNP